MQNSSIKILITYCSGYGATFEIAQKVGDFLALESSLSVHVEPIQYGQNIDEYDVVIVGSSVRADKVLAITRDFFAEHYDTLLQKKVAFFLVSLTANSPEGREKVKKEFFPQITDKFPKINYLAMAAFGGKIDFNRLNPVMQNLVRHVLAKTGLDTNGSIDTRDWNYITNWARSLCDEILKSFYPVSIEKK